MPRDRNTEPAPRDRTATRVYHALVEGRVRGDTGTLRCNLHPDSAFRTTVASQGKLAVSHYRVVERSAARTLLEEELVTGRRHQIRAQLANVVGGFDY